MATLPSHGKSQIEFAFVWCYSKNESRREKRKTECFKLFSTAQFQISSLEAETIAKIEFGDFQGPRL